MNRRNIIMVKTSSKNQHLFTEPPLVSYQFLFNTKEDILNNVFEEIGCH